MKRDFKEEQTTPMIVTLTACKSKFKPIIFGMLDCREKTPPINAFLGYSKFTCKYCWSPVAEYKCDLTLFEYRPEAKGYDFWACCTNSCRQSHGEGYFNGDIPKFAVLSPS